MSLNVVLEYGLTRLIGESAFFFLDGLFTPWTVVSGVGGAMVKGLFG